MQNCCAAYRGSRPSGSWQHATAQGAHTPAGRHHRSATLRDRALRALEVAGRLGTLVTLVALLLVAGAVGGLFAGTPASANATVTATFGP